MPCLRMRAIEASTDCGSSTMMIGRVLWQEFFNNRDWPVASAVAIVMLVLLVVPIMVFHRAQSRELESRLA